MSSAKPQPIPLDHAVQSILDYPHGILTAVEAAALTSRDRSLLSEACRRGLIEAHSSSVRGKGAKSHWQFSKAALIAYIWNNTSGSKSLIRAALAERAPKLLALLESESGADAPAAELPANVIDATPELAAPTKRKRKSMPSDNAKSAPVLSQLELFSRSAS